VCRSGIEIFCHAIDLGQPPDVLLVQMSDLSDRIAAFGYAITAPGDIASSGTPARMGKAGI
jgi:hypothetical protein